MAILDEDAAFPVEDQTPRRAPRERPLVVVFGQLFESRVLDNLKRPEADRQYGEDRTNDDLETAEPRTSLAPFFNGHFVVPFCAAGFYRRNLVLVIFRRSTAPGNNSTT
jgi:hypothetical protein